MNKDLLNSAKDEMVSAIESGNTKEFANQVVDMIQNAKEETLKLYAELKDVTDEKALSQRGIKALTKEENEFYNSVVQSARNDAGLANLPLVMPVTVVDRVFEELATEHPLLSEIQFENVKGQMKWLVNTGIGGAATWGDLCDAITATGESGFAAINVDLFKLSVAMPVCLTAIELGNVWLDRYVRTVLGELIANALCDAIINGDGSKKPIGMIKTIAAAGTTQTIPAVTKQAAAITDLGVATLGGIARELSNNGKRIVGTMLMVVNPADYYALVMPAMKLMNAVGQYTEYLPYPVKVVPDAHMTQGTAVFGIAKNYWAGVGLTKDGKVSFSDEYKFLDDVRWFKHKLVAGGQPKDNNSFVLKDISGLTPAYISVKEVQ